MCKEYSGIFYLMDNDFNHLYFSSVEFDSTKINYYYDLSDNQLKKSGILEVINSGPLRLENEEFTFVIKGFENGKIKRYNLNTKSSVNNDYAYPVLKTDSKNLFVPIENFIPKKITINNNSGKEIQKISKEFKIIDNHIILDIDALQSGIYLISAEFENNKTQNYKFIK